MKPRSIGPEHFGQVIGCVIADSSQLAWHREVAETPPQDFYSPGQMQTGSVSMNKSFQPLMMAAAACAAWALGACVWFEIERPVDLSGGWTLTMDPDFSGNRAVSDCRIKQTDSKLSVRCGDGAEVPGTIKDAKVVWGFSAPAGERYGAATWTGVVAPSHRAIEGTWHLSVAGGDLDGKFSATKKSN
jgi:hypothetical protein